LADRFFSPGLTTSGPVVLTGDEAHHLARVARREVGDVVEVFNGRGLGVRARVETLERARVVLSRLDELVEIRSSVSLTLYVAPPKGDRFDWIVEKATELGVVRLVPLKTERSVVDPRAGKLERLRRVVVEASKQCGRNRLMELEEPVGLAAAFAREGDAIRLIAYQGGLAPESWPCHPGGSFVALAVGPEGGWTDGERRLAAESGWQCIGLGPTRLRVETAALVGSAIVFSRVLESAP
jgi:16S rRNA (uracil1498-N3)-methyltransferase